MRFAGLFALAVFFLPVAAFADLVNINTADLAAFETLPGIGPSKGQAIIDYRTQYGPFAQISDIQNVSGIGPSTYTNIESLITVGSSGSANAGAAATSTAESAQTYVPPPSAISVNAGADLRAIANVPVAFTATVSDPAARVFWAFGDGSSAEGRVVEKTFRYSGSYLVMAKAVDGEAAAYDDLMVSVSAAAVRITSLANEGVTIANDTSGRLDLSKWRLDAGVGSFRFPEGTMILPGASAFFPNEITNLPVAQSATLRFPSGLIAAHYEPTMQLSVSATSSQVVQTEGSADRNSVVSEPIHELESVNAPAAADTLAAAGAAFASGTPEASPGHSGGGLLHSPWTIGFLGILVLAGGALMVL